MEQHGSQLMDFHEILYCGLLFKSVEKIKVSSLSEENIIGAKSTPLARRVMKTKIQRVVIFYTYCFQPDETLWQRCILHER
jgi:hypothetical protein